jgi:hypothetical protein
VIEALTLDLLRRGYSILNKPRGRRKGADIIARDPDSKVRMFISAAGRARPKDEAEKQQVIRTESQVLACMSRSVYTALRMHDENQFSPGDQIALAFPDVSECQKYLAVEKPVLDSLGVKIFVVKDNKDVATF